MKKTRLLFLAILAASIAACSTTRNAAPVVDRQPAAKAAEAPRTVAPKDPRAYYTVKRGDTLYRIALETGQSYRDIVAWNNLLNANDIKVDQVLRVMPPDGVASTMQATQATQGQQQANSGVEVRPLSAAAPTSAPTNKTSPHGEKRSYSDAALAELQKPDRTAPAKADAAKAVDAAAAAGTGDEAVTWMWPASGKILTRYEEGKRGIDIAGKSGQQVLAAASGKVMYAGSSIRGYGNLVIIKHTDNLLSAYAHNKTILVKEDQIVSKGQKIAEMGNSDSDAVKLHFEIRQQGKPVDPSKFLPNR